jgi:hypothetical protein
MITKQYWRFLLVLLCAVWIASCCPPEFVSIDPEAIPQGNLNWQIELTANCTLFKEGNTLINFVPPEGITVHDVVVEDKTTLSFLIDVDEDSPVGRKDVVVTYGDEVPKTITGVQRLEVLPAS